MNRVVVGFLIVSFVFVSVGCDTSLVMTTSTLEKNAWAYYEAEQYDQALKFCDRLCGRKPTDFEASSLRCHILMDLDQKDEALAAAKYAFDLDPDATESLRLRAYAFSLNEMHMESIEDWKVIIERSPKSCSNQVQIAYEYEKLGDYQKSIEHLLLGLSFSKDHAIAWNNLSSIYSMAAKPGFLNGKKAKKYAARAVKYASTDEEKCYAWDTFGSALAASGDFERAIKSARKAMTFTDKPTLIADIEKRISLYGKREIEKYKIAEQASTYWPSLQESTVAAE